MAQKDVTINDILNGGKGSPGNGGTTATGTTRGTDTTSSQPPATGGGSTATPPVDGAQGVVDFGNSASAQPKKPVTTAEATDPTQAAINLVEQQQAQQAPTPASTGNFTPNVQTTTHSSTASTTGNTTTTPTGSNGDVGKDKDAAAVDTEPQDSKKKSAMSYADMFAAMEPYKEPTKEELEKERKKEKRERLFAAIGDGISALSNLFFTTQYAPNMYDPNKETNSERVENYWTNLKKEREANRQRYVDGYIKAKQADDLHAIQQQNADAAAEWKKADTERKNAIAKAQGEVLAARAAKDQSAADLAAKKLEYLIAGWPEEQAKKQAEIDLLKAKKKQADAQTNNANASADEHRRRGTASWVGGSSDKGGNSGGKGGKPYATLNGVPYASKADYERAVVSYAKQYGIPLQYKKKGGVGGMTETTTNRTIASLASDVEALYRKTHAKSKPNAPSKSAKKGGGAKGGNWASGLKL